MWRTSTPDLTSDKILPTNAVVLPVPAPACTNKVLSSSFSMAWRTALSSVVLSSVVLPPAVLFSAVLSFVAFSPGELLAVIFSSASAVGPA